MTPILVNDNAIELLKAQGKEVTFRTAKDDKEFYSLLKQKLISDIQKMSNSQDRDRKLDFLIDTYYDLGAFFDYIKTVSSKDVDGEMAKRFEKTGSFHKRIVIEGIKEIPKDYSIEVEEIIKFGEEHEYPRMIMGRNEKNVPYAWLDKGENAWRKTTTRHDDVFFKLLDSVRRKDIHEEGRESKTQSD